MNTCHTSGCENPRRYATQCKSCYDKARYQRNREDFLDVQRIKRETSGYKTYMKEYRQRHPDQHRAYGLKPYGLTLEQYDAILSSQGGTCAICPAPFTVTKTGKHRNLDVDHDHTCCPGIKSCGKCIRGLLCHRCNISLGAFEDNTQLLQKAITYLQTKGIT